MKIDYRPTNNSLTTTRRFLSASVALLVGVLALAGCRQDMHDQPRYKPLARSTFFADGQASRPMVEGTVPRGHLRLDEHLYRGRINGQHAEMFPQPVDRQMLLRGRERYNVFCTPCHGGLGDGRGIVVRRGMQQPESFHSPRLREAPPGYYFEVITNGFGAMYDYSSRLSPQDRWAVIAYIRALQLSQNADFSRDVPAERRSELEGQ